mgnify:FL=1
MNVVIVGQGAVGLLWHRHLSLSKKNNVQLLCSSSIITAPSSYTFNDLTGNTEKVSTAQASIYSIKDADIILVCVKSFQVVDAINQLSPTLNSNAIVILCHNGMGVLEQLPEAFTQQHTILSMLITHGAKLNSPFNIRHTGQGKADIGVISGSITNNTSLLVTNIFNSALPNAYFHKEITHFQWQKLAINCVINPLTAMYNISNGAIAQAFYTDVKKQILEEVVAVAHAEGITLKLNELIDTVNHVALSTAENCSSMRSDILAKRPTEIDYINGYIAKLGAKHNIPTPINSDYWQKITAITA